MTSPSIEERVEELCHDLKRIRIDRRRDQNGYDHFCSEKRLHIAYLENRILKVFKSLRNTQIDGHYGTMASRPPRAILSRQTLLLSTMLCSDAQKLYTEMILSQNKEAVCRIMCEKFVLEDEIKSLRAKYEEISDIREQIKTLLKEKYDRKVRAQQEIISILKRALKIEDKPRFSRSFTRGARFSWVTLTKTFSSRNFSDDGPAPADLELQESPVGTNRTNGCSVSFGLPPQDVKKLPELNPPGEEQGEAEEDNSTGGCGDNMSEEAGATVGGPHIVATEISHDGLGELGTLSVHSDDSKTKGFVYLVEGIQNNDRKNEETLQLETIGALANGSQGLLLDAAENGVEGRIDVTLPDLLPHTAFDTASSIVLLDPEDDVESPVRNKCVVNAETPNEKIPFQQLPTTGFHLEESATFKQVGCSSA